MPRKWQRNEERTCETNAAVIVKEIKRNETSKSARGRLTSFRVVYGCGKFPWWPTPPLVRSTRYFENALGPFFEKHLFRSNSAGAFQSRSSHAAVSCAASSTPSLLLALFRFLVHLDMSVRSSSSPLPPPSCLLPLLYHLSSSSLLPPTSSPLPPLFFLSSTFYLLSSSSPLPPTSSLLPLF